MSALVVDGVGRAKSPTALGGCNDSWCVTGLGNYSAGDAGVAGFIDVDGAILQH